MSLSRRVCAYARWFLLAALALSCRSENAAPIQLVVGNDVHQRVTFTPVSAFAEYVQVAGSGNELHLTLAGYEASCERFVPPKSGQALVSVSVVTPRGSPLAPGVFGWDGHPAHGGTQTSPERAYAVPNARIGQKSFVFPPGGSIRLSEVALERAGKLKGFLAFEFAGSAEREAASISGSFEARLCRVRL
ncbi:MAG TPA: hypothetical protein VK524_24290 [Polyangiaceae bacterium]|nr:hypothetical protein [Polyangiaceae bacterium]